jgi:hypothetical protein
LVVRLIQNLWLHPPFCDAYSDMGGYIDRARDIFDKPWAPDPSVAFFPYGTHLLVFSVQRVFGRESDFAVGVAFALIGTAAVTFSYLAARRLLGERTRLSLAIGLMLALYVPWVRNGSFVLSETPLAAAIAISSWLALRVADEGRSRDAALLGVTLALGMTFRPQLLASVLMLGVVALWARKRSSVSARSIVFVTVPIVLVLAASAVRTHYHTGRYGLVSTNGAFNLALGRCHPLWLSSANGGSYSSPSFDRLHGYAERNGMRPLIELDPALGENLTLDGDLWDGAPALALARKCIATTGFARQVKYSLSHIVLLWFYNAPWPSPRTVTSAVFAILAALLVPGFILSLVLARQRDALRVWILAAHVFGLLATAIVFYGEARLRLPYDGVLLTLAVYGYAEAASARARRAAPATA